MIFWHINTGDTIMDFITPKGYEAYGLASEYIDGDITTKTRGSIVKARAIEVLLRELHKRDS